MSVQEEMSGKKRRKEGLQEWWEQRNKYDHYCYNCKFRWSGYKKRPDKCPKCSNKDWDKDIPRDRLGQGRHKSRSKNYVPFKAVGLPLDIRNGLEKLAILQYDGSMADALRDICDKHGVEKLSDQQLNSWKKSRAAATTAA